MATKQKASTTKASAKTKRAPLVDPRESAPKAKPPAPKPAAAAPVAKTEPDTPIARRKTTEEKKREELVSVTVPRAFKFTTEDHSMIDYPVGIYDMPKHHATDSFAQGMGVVINE